MIYRLVIGGIAGAAIGSLLGYYGKCSGGACVMMGSPLRGIIVGTLMGLLMASSSRSSLGPVPEFAASPHFVEVIDKDHFLTLLNKNRLVLVDFYSNSCAPCRHLKPVVHALADEYAGSAVIAGVNVETLRDIAGEYGVRAVPHVIVFQDGLPVHNSTGLKSKDSFVQVLDRLNAAAGASPPANSAVHAGGIVPKEP